MGEYKDILTDLPYEVLADHADTVTLLLRREYYEPCDKPGKAEIIVAKNRNNSIGSFYLTYNKEYVKFYNCIPTSYSEFSFEQSEKEFSPFSPN
ncbi:replicative DNA helicase [Candidatus Rubidus massiliensis]|nr:replicative DNA helicase [Candidatus Rubidus massiliensis]